MNKLNLLSLIINAAAFLMIASANITVANTPAIFNPNAIEYRGKVVVAKTFATWCRYCRQEAIKEAQLIKEPNVIQTNQITNVNNDVVNLVLVTEDDYEKSVRFYEELGLQPKILCISEKQMNKWGITLFPSTLIFNNSKLVRLFGGEVQEEEVYFTVEKQLNNK